MIEHNLFYCPYASFTNGHLPLLKAAALYFDKLVILDPSARVGRPSAGSPNSEVGELTALNM